jgi:hypothetical protein
VDRSCLTLIDALEGGYRYGSTDQEHPLEEHPYEDVVDCLRYAIVHKCRIPGKPIRRPTRPYKPRNRYTGY